MVLSRARLRTSIGQADLPQSRGALTCGAWRERVGVEPTRDRDAAPRRC